MSSTTLDRYRALYPSAEHHLFLNHAAVAPANTRVTAAMAEWADDLLHHAGLNEDTWVARMERTRALCARLLGCATTEIALIRNTGHGLSLVAAGLAWKPGDAIAVATGIEYPSNVFAWTQLRERGVSIQDIPASVDGGVTREALERVITASTRLVAVSAVQFASGHRTDLESIGALCAERGILFCVDGIQAVGAAPIDVKKARIHFLAASGHKWMLGPPGAGLLFVDASVVERVKPVLLGWGSAVNPYSFESQFPALHPDARKFEEGNAAYGAVYGFCAALEMLEEVGMGAVSARIQEHLAHLEKGLVELGFDVGPAPSSRAGILMFTHPRRPAQELFDTLTKRGVALSLRRGRLRVSPHFYTSSDDVERFLAMLR